VLNKTFWALSADSERDKKKHTTFSHLQPACVVRSSPNFVWW